MTEIIAKKIGMTQIYDKNGLVEPVTVLEAGPCIVVNIRTKEKNGYLALQLGFGKFKKPSKPIEGYYKKQGINDVFKYLMEFRVEKLDGYQVGQVIKADSFKMNEVVSVSGTSIGKGFQGSVKRHHFNRHPMTHGSKSHRMPGSSGSGTFMGHVQKGKRRAGHMGHVRVTIKNSEVIYLDAENNIMAIRGSVPGPNGTILEVRGNGVIGQPRVRRIAQARLEKAAKIAAKEAPKK